ncbi:hypothetical protein MAPG_06453 [Magnaporthiopsis poae ATCC 64411]|uniref:Uncharacterized protein n=1 Tax=Magnaporthiopsis poae (strain ATCC 64411 / 73-15) TaxID=644358 RepID=A0A0C4E226_MAGP6|nr:hypothetical protein MAPG_06453 [Magnaporthiopsis poae ATCC 64411]
MPITRAFTSRRVKQSLELRDAAEGVISKGNAHKSSQSVSSIRNKISAPVQLISTTNMLSYNAPDIRPKINSATSITPSTSESDSDSARSVGSPGSTPPTSPDSPFTIKRSPSPEPNHLSCYFTPPGQAANAPTPTQAPVIPTRAPSHTKKSHDILTRHRSASRLSEQSSRTVSTKGSFSFSRSSSTSTNTTTTSRSASFSNSSNSKAPLPAITQTPLPAPPSPPRPQRKEPSAAPSNPFGNELARVTELAEEFGGKAVSKQVMRQEEADLLNKGYKKFRPDSYLDEVQGLYADFFAEEKTAKPLWI